MKGGDKFLVELKETVVRRDRLRIFAFSVDFKPPWWWWEEWKDAHRN